MCKETERELKVGKDLAKKLVDHLKTMGAGSCEIPVGEYVITVKNAKEI